MICTLISYMHWLKTMMFLVMFKIVGGYWDWNILLALCRPAE